MFEWSESYSVGVHGIDAQHKNVFRLAAEFHRAIVSGEGKAFIPQLLDRLVQYTAVHFAYEERLMQEAGYPNLPAHKAEHEELTKKLLRFQSDFKAGRTDLAFEMFQALRQAVRQHILGSDLQYAPYVKKMSQGNQQPKPTTLPAPAAAE